MPVPEFCCVPTAFQFAGALMVALFRTAICAIKMLPTLPGFVIASEVTSPAAAVLDPVREMFGSMT